MSKRENLISDYAEQLRANRATGPEPDEREPLDLPNVARLAEGFEPPICEWYALCDREAVGTTPHPILGAVPICQRCADKHELAVEPFGGKDGETCEGCGARMVDDPAGAPGELRCPSCDGSE